ncbi:sensor histidine kinase [Desulfopila aestuarii]|uniref:histidine kinase n=1 Tax=Desulfopila aestuarii DSM 18488 TaxID=1121416 RepID=A0A1M7XX66_9BACT|nr:histidine kinase dimerization/phosphoacceptor domain -containing protein [Desulfopila aestuarii]SHO43478.1 PAS domain S-box-containing protein [Desulfopila aestuarii DSM 18488]
MTDHLCAGLQRIDNDVTVLKRTQEQRATERDLLRICHLAENVNSLMYQLVDFFQTLTRCEAVAVRLKQGDDFPYYESRGFPKAFIKAENSLCVRDPFGNILRDNLGNPVLECMCGNILTGRFDPTKPFFTHSGSFWTNSTSELLATTSEDDRQARTRNRCNGEGYESVALIPLRIRQTTFGLFQFNDPQRNRFNLSLIKQLEGLVDYVALSLSKHLTDEELRNSEEKYRLLVENAQEAIIVVQDNRLVLVNPKAMTMSGYTHDELTAGSLASFIHEDDRAMVARHNRKWLTQGEKTSSYCFRIICKNGDIKWMEQNCSRIIWNEKPATLIFLNDITEWKNADKALQTTLAEKEVLLREVHHRVKNNLAAIIGLFELQRRIMVDSSTRDTLAVLTSRVRAMSLVHEKLYRSDSLSEIDFQEYLQSLVSHLRTSFGSPNICCEIDAHGIRMPLDLAVPCGMIINELVTNSLKYAFPEGRAPHDAELCRIMISLVLEDGIFTLSVADNGIGLDPKFDWSQAQTLGLVLVRMLGQHQLAGRYSVDQTAGTRFTLTFSIRDERKSYE